MSRLPFKIKICGVTTLDDATYSIGYGADAIGLNFYQRSKRCVVSENAGEIALFYSTTIPIVGVFVDESLPNIDRIHSTVDFRWFQLHGAETPNFLAQIKSEFKLPIIRAFAWGPERAQPIDNYLMQCAELNCLPDAILIDAYKTGEFGGTGETADWDAIAQWREQSKFDIPLVLAGGLTPDNVTEAIARVRPDAVDTASGVEVSPGRKDPGKIAAFVAAAKEAFAAISD
jgi:phosphoribosylanthranilate isomerase